MKVGRWWATLALVVLAPTATGVGARAAGRRVRPLFEPTDLELEEAGTVEADLQTGWVRGSDADRLVIPDLEIDLGLLPNLEIDLDGAYAIAGPDGGGWGLDHAAPDSLWAALKLGIASVDWPDQAAGVGLGVQIGPKFPVAPGTHGLGFEAVLLAGARRGRWHVALNLGGFADPGAEGGGERPRGLEAGLDFDLDLDAAGIWSLTGELGGVAFVSSDPHQLVATAGIAWSVRPDLDLSLTGLWGFLDGGDRAGLILGLSPKISLWH